MTTSPASVAAMETSSMQESAESNTITDIQCTSNATANKTETTPTMLMTPPPTPTPTPPSPKATITRIPHPSMTDSLSPFHRSSSMRVRGTKSNLLSSETALNATPAVNCSPSSSSPSSSSSTLLAVAGSHDFGTTAGAFSSRRKVALRSSPVRTLNQNNSTLFAGHLTRSSSLQRNYRNSGHKTAALKQATEHTFPIPFPSTTEFPLCDGAAAAAANKEFNLDLHTKQDNDEALFNANNMAANATTTTTADTDVDAVELKARNMSLNLNGGSNSGTTTTATIVNGTTTATTPKTPKTPLETTNTPIAQHTCIRQGHCGKKHATTSGVGCSGGAVIIAAGKLATVPETKLSPKTPPVTPDSPSTYLDDDLDSMYSFATTTSGRSTMSCEHPYVARNGTTFSGRKMKYVVHCSNYAGQVGPDYLTPTQRAQRQIKRLKELLCIARQDLEQKDTEILRLTREVVELRLFKASLSSPEERSASSDAVTVREAELKTSQDVSPIVDMSDDAAKASPRHMARLQQQHQQQQQLHLQTQTSSAGMQMSAEMQSSFADSGHFEDITTSSLHSKDSHTATHDDDGAGDVLGEHVDVTDNAIGGSGANSLEGYELQRQELIRMYEQRIEELIRTQDSATSDMKRSHNDKVEALLQKLAECNTRYADIVPDYEHAKERIRELEKQLEDLQRKLVEHEEKQNKMYLHMYQKGQEAERIARADQALELVHRQPESKVSINELLHQLQSTQDELENIRAAECRMNECGSNHALLTAKEAISLWVLGARKTIYRRLLEAQKNRTHVDPEVTLQFLKSAVYYFLTDKENSQGHLQAIESILEFTEAEKQNINKARTPK